MNSESSGNPIVYRFVSLGILQWPGFPSVMPVWHNSFPFGCPAAPPALNYPGEPSPSLRVPQRWAGEDGASATPGSELAEELQFSTYWLGSLLGVCVWFLGKNPTTSYVAGKFTITLCNYSLNICSFTMYFIFWYNINGNECLKDYMVNCCDISCCKPPTRRMVLAWFFRRLSIVFEELSILLHTRCC